MKPVTNQRVLHSMLSDRLFQMLLWLALILALVMASLPEPPPLPGSPSDKVQHFVAFLVLSALAVLAYPRQHLVTIFICLVLFGGMIEIVQAIPSLGRQPSWHDWFADVAATSIGLLIMGVFRHLQRKKATRS